MWRIAGLLIVVATTLALPGQAKAICRIHTPDVAYDNAGVIFSGRVISTDDLSKPPPWNTTMSVDRVWKGEVLAPAQVTVSSGIYPVRFQSGIDYLVYGVRVDETPRIYTDACTGTAPLDESADMLAHLDRTVPKRQPWVAVGIALLLIGGITVVIRGRPRAIRVGPPGS
ncbi:MAG: hypothetical protein V9F06_01665 [Thermomicrobiales bacterium]